MQYPYSEVKNFNKNELMKNNPFLEIIQRKININTLHDLIYKEMLITSILEQRFQAKLIIKKFLKSKINFINFLEIIVRFEKKKKIILNQIRNQMIYSIEVIKRNINYYILRKKIKSIIQKQKLHYTVYSSIKNVTNVNIKIYVDYIKLEKYKIFSMNYCPIRKTFYINIPKKKFIKSNKTMRFNFMIGGHKVLDKSYLIKLYNGERINEINFIDFDKKIKQLNDTIYKEISKPKIIKNYSSDISTERETFSSDDDEYSQLGKKINIKKNKVIKKIGQLEEGSIEQFRRRKRIISCDETFHLKSILRNKLGINLNRCESKNNNAKKRVRFGSVEFSY